MKADTLSDYVQVWFWLLDKTAFFTRRQGNGRSLRGCQPVFNKKSQIAVLRHMHIKHV